MLEISHRYENSMQNMRTFKLYLQGILFIIKSFRLQSTASQKLPK